MAEKRREIPERDRTLESLDEAEIRRLEARCRWRRYRDGERVLDSGSSSRDVYFVASGAVSIVNFSLSGKEVTLATAKAGSYFASSPPSTTSRARPAWSRSRRR